MASTKKKRTKNEVRTRIQIAMMNEIGNAINDSDLSTMTVLEMAAAALGSIYREAANAHSDSNPACPCGWSADPVTEIETLARVLRTSSCHRHLIDEFEWIPIQGSA